jgi:PfaD family protein
LPSDRLDEALGAIRGSLGDLPFAANLIHTPRNHRTERAVVDLLLRHRVRCAEASAFTALSPELVRYRLAGLRADPRSGVHVGNRVVAKVSRAEVAELFLRPAPEPLVAELLAAGDVTPEQARLARDVPMADDITVEADSAGHTDRRPLTVLVPQMLRLRERIAASVRIGAAGSIGTPQAVHAAFALGADYVVTGSINQACVEAGTSPEVKRLLAQSAFMFEAGATVQVLKKGSLFAQRADRLYRLYREYDGIDDLPGVELDRLLANVFPDGLERAWAQVEAYLRDHEPAELGRAESDRRHRMALLFRSYLGMSSRWAASGDATRSGDYQIWCGPAMGAFNLWTRSTALEEPANRHVAEVAGHLLRGAAFCARLAQLRFAGVRIPAACADYRLPPVHQPAVFRR